MSCDLGSFWRENIWVSKVSQAIFFLPRPIWAHSTRPSPHSTSFTHSFFFCQLFYPDLSRHMTHDPVPRPHSVRSSRGFLFNALFASLTGVHSSTLERFPIDVEDISKLLLFTLFKTHSQIWCKTKTTFLFCQKPKTKTTFFSVVFPPLGASHVRFLGVFIGSHVV